LPGEEEPQYSVSYTAGYVLPSQYRLDVATVSAAVADNSFNDSASGFPSLLKAGDVVIASGLSNAANNGFHVVSGTPTTAKIVVTSTLVNENAAAGRSLRFRPPAEVRAIDDVEKACLETVKAWYLRRKDDDKLIEKQAGPMRQRFADNVSLLGFPPICVGLLRPWMAVSP
jgi:hypothetical protein